MFALHETTQRRVCRVSFLVLCVVPTLLTLAGIAYCNRPWRQADWQRSLAQHMHVRATLGDITRPRPGITILTDLRLADLPTGQPLGSIGKLNFTRGNSQLSLQADRLEVPSKQLSALATSLITWLTTEASSPVQFNADRLVVTSDRFQSAELRDLKISNETSHPKHQHFRLTARDIAGDEVKLSLRRTDDIWQSKVVAQQATLPSWLIGKLVPGTEGLGDAAFSGEIVVKSSRDGWRGRLKGQFDDVDLQSWVGAACPHRLRGVGRLELEQLTWADDRIEFAQGTLQADRGDCSYSLLLNARDLCRCVTGPKWETINPADEQEVVPFDQLAMSFQMNETGIAFAGRCAGGGVMTAEGAPLLFAPPPDVVLPVGQLVQLLDYRRQPGWLPATRRAHEMAEKLPLPDATASE